MLKLYRLAENPQMYFIGETATKQVFLHCGSLQKMQDAMIGFFVPEAFWKATVIDGDTYLQWLKATLF